MYTICCSAFFMIVFPSTLMHICFRFDSSFGAKCWFRRVMKYYFFILGNGASFTKIIERLLRGVWTPTSIETLQPSLYVQLKHITYDLIK